MKADPADDKFIACATDLGAAYIVSGDKHLLSLKRYFDIRVVSPKEFVEQFPAVLP